MATHKTTWGRSGEGEVTGDDARLGLVKDGGQATGALPAAPVKIHLAISRDVVLSSNVDLHWAQTAKRVKVIRDMGIVMGRTTRASFHQATCEVEVTWPDKRRRDAANLYPTFKAAIDGFIDAKVLLDDSDRYMKALTIKAAGRTLRTPGIACYLTFTFTEVS